MNVSRASFTVFGWIGTVILLVDGLLLSLWAIFTVQPSYLWGAFGMLALAFVVAGVMNMWLRRLRRAPQTAPGRVWALAGAFAGVVVVAIAITVLVSNSITG